MHELGVVMEAVRTVEDFAAGHGVTKIGALVLQIGELSSMVPRYVEECFPAAADGTPLEGAELRIEILPGNARCRACGKVWRLLEGGDACPSCGSGGPEILGGREFVVKEIVAL